MYCGTPSGDVSYSLNELFIYCVRTIRSRDDLIGKCNEDSFNIKSVSLLNHE